ncbi:hypothetical protein JTB14_004675 [Gonioctena quinquepunctata]|nr:hypothetical protein JTB14_004675 [Gonioctena quinquepunctata]
MDAKEKSPEPPMEMPLEAEPESVEDKVVEEAAPLEEQSKTGASADETETPPKKNTKRTRGKRKSEKSLSTTSL